MLLMAPTVTLELTLQVAKLYSRLAVNDMGKKTLVDLVLIVVSCIAITVEIIVGFRMLENKWASDTGKIANLSAIHGQEVGLIEETPRWEEAPSPTSTGDIVAIEENRFQVNGVSTKSSDLSTDKVYYSSVDDNNAAHYLQYNEVLDPSTVDTFHTALTQYFAKEDTPLLNLLPMNVQAANITCYQQTLADGAIPVIFDAGSNSYIMFLDCGSSYYTIQCDEPFILSEGSITVHYGIAGDDPMTQHAWSTYEAGAIDNTRKALSDDDTINSYTQQGTVIAGESAVGQASSGNIAIDGSGNAYTGTSEVNASNQLYMTDEDERMRELLVSYGGMEFNADGTSVDGNTVIDTTSATAKASEWVLTATQYSFTDKGITINGLSGKLTNDYFQVGGKASNTISSARPWVLCVKFLDEDGNLLGVKSIDNRSNPIPADGVSDFFIQLETMDNIEFQNIKAIQFAVN